MLSSLQSRLVLSNLLITLAGLLVLVGVVTYVLTARNSQVRERELAHQSQAFAAQVETLYAQRGTVQELKQEVYAASRLLGERIILVSPTGRFVVDSAHATPFVTGSWHPLNREAFAAERSARASLSSQHLVLFQSPIRGTSGRNGGAVLLVAKVSDVRPDLATLADVILTAVGTALVVWLAIGFYFTSSLSRPLLRITEATGRMARGDYQVRVPVQGTGEIARLAASFNGMAAQVQQAQQLLKDFVANVSHDLRTPLTMIAGFSQALLDGTAGPGEVEASAAVIHDEAEKMQRLVDDLLQLTRLESGLLKIERHPIPLHPFVQRTIERLWRADGRESIAVENLVPADGLYVEVDPDQLERALRNLLDNALEHTEPGGRVAVAARRLDGAVEITVSDTGVGIPREDLPRIFERFYRSDKSRGRGRGHSGLGLAIVREIVEAHGSEITVDSEPGRGTSFRFSVPLANQVPAEASHST